MIIKIRISINGKKVILIDAEIMSYDIIVNKETVIANDALQMIHEILMINAISFIFYIILSKLNRVILVIFLKKKMNMDIEIILLNY